MSGAQGARPLMDEWRRPDRDVRIDVLALAPLRDVSEQYVAPPRSVRMLWTYIRRVGLRVAIRKVRSRMAERGRNAKIAGFGYGAVIEAPADAGLQPGDRVFFFAPTVHPEVKRAVIDRAFVGPAAGEQGGGEPSLPKELEPYRAWSSFAGIPLDEARISRGLDRLVEDAGGALAAGAAPPSGATAVVERREATGGARGRRTAAIFGLGHYAKQLIVPNIPDEYHLACVHELDPRQLAGWAREGVTLDTCPWPRPEESYDLWFVSGYHSTHTPIALTALERSGAVAVEKPVATTMKQVDALEAALRARPDARLWACFQRRYAVYTPWITEDLGARPGDPVNYDCIVFEVPLSPLHWYCWPSSGSRLISNGCHWIDHFMQLNDYADVVASEVAPGGRNGATAFLTLANGAEFVMRLTEVGSPRIGVRDHVEASLGDRTVTIRNASDYVAEDSIRTIRRARVNVMDAYGRMYREICRRALVGEPGDAVETLKSSAATVRLDEQLKERLGR